jgi:hypothetical protein
MGFFQLQSHLVARFKAIPGIQAMAIGSAVEAVQNVSCFFLGFWLSGGPE